MTDTDKIAFPPGAPTEAELDEMAASQHRLIAGARAVANIMIEAVEKDVKLSDEDQQRRLYLACEMNKQLIATANACAQHERWLRQFYYPVQQDRLR